MTTGRGADRRVVGLQAGGDDRLEVCREPGGL